MLKHKLSKANFKLLNLPASKKLAYDVEIPDHSRSHVFAEHDPQWQDANNLN